MEPPTIIEAVFSGGVFRPIGAVTLPENAHVRLTISSLPPAVAEWLAAQNLGTTRELTPMNPADHTVIHPIAELKMRAPHVEIITVVSDVD